MNIHHYKTPTHIQLKPCPFCGGTEAPEIVETQAGQFIIYCLPECPPVAGGNIIGCGGQVSAMPSMEEAAAAWNRRA